MQLDELQLNGVTHIVVSMVIPAEDVEVMLDIRPARPLHSMANALMREYIQILREERAQKAGESMKTTGLKTDGIVSMGGVRA